MNIYIVFFIVSSMWIKNISANYTGFQDNCALAISSVLQNIDLNGLKYSFLTCDPCYISKFEGYEIDPRSVQGRMDNQDNFFEEATVILKSFTGKCTCTFESRLTSLQKELDNLASKNNVVKACTQIPKEDASEFNNIGIIDLNQCQAGVLLQNLIPSLLEKYKGIVTIVTKNVTLKATIKSQPNYETYNYEEYTVDIGLQTKIECGGSEIFKTICNCLLKQGLFSASTIAVVEEIFPCQNTELINRKVLNCYKEYKKDVLEE